MAIDRALKAILTRHEDILVKLVEGQVRNDAAIAKLTDQVTRSVGLVSTLAVEMQHLTQAQHHTEDAVRQLGERVGRLADGQAALTQRVDGFTDVVLRGFTKRDEDHTALEARVAKVEHQ